MSIKVLIAHAEGEEDKAELLAKPLEEAGYEPVHYGTILVGESFTEEASKLLSCNGPVVLCGSIKAAGTGLPYRLINAARSGDNIRIFPVLMETGAYLGPLAQDGKVTNWQNPAQAAQELVAALTRHYPLDADSRQVLQQNDLESRYRELLLKTYDIVDLAEMGDDDRHLATQDLKIRRLYVALRMRLEIQAGDEVNDATLEKLEKRRATGWDWEQQHSREDEEKVSLGDRLQAARRLVVLGDPGAGKSTLLRWLTTAYLLRLKSDPDWSDLPDIATLPNQEWLPVLIRCRDLPPNCGTLDEMLHHSLRKAQLNEAECCGLRDLLRGKLERGEALLLVDGLDEITDPTARIRFAKDLEQIHRRFSDAPVVITSRIVGYREMGYRIRSGFEHLTVADLSKEDKDEFAQRWCELTEKSRPPADVAAELMRDIHSNNRIERLTGNPMLLTTMALIKRKIGRLPQRRVDLYEKAVEVLLNWRREVDTPLDKREALPQLEYLAHAMCDRGVQQIREDEVLDWLRQARQDYPNIHSMQQHSPEEFLVLLEGRTGLLIQSGHVRHNGHSVPVYEFRHLTFQEYLAGMALVQKHYQGHDKNKTLAEVIAPLAGQVKKIKNQIGGEESAVVENWREALRLCLAACNDDVVDTALLAILRPLPEETDTERARAVMAALCLADEPNVSSAVAREVLERLTVQVGDDDGNGSVQTAIDAATMELAVSRWADNLSESLLSEFFQCEAGRRGTLGVLCSMVREAQTPTEETAFTAWLNTQAERLSGCEEQEATAIALTVMINAFRGKNCQVSGMTDALIQRLSGGTALSHAAAWALCWMNQQSSWHPSPEQLSQLLAATANPNCDSETVRWLTEIFKNEHTVQAVDALLLHLPRVLNNTRNAIVGALVAIGDARAVDALLERLQDQQEDKELRGKVVGALGQIGDARAVDALLERLQDQQEDKELRGKVVRALGQIGDARAVDALLERLQDQQEDRELRMNVAGALGRTNDARAVDVLLERLQDQQEDRELRMNVAGALGQIGDARAVDALLECLQDQQENMELRGSVAGALGQIGDARAVDVLLERLQDQQENKELRRTVAGALGKIGDARAVDALLERLQDQQEGMELRDRVVEALGKIGDTRGLIVVRSYMKDEDKSLRCTAMKGLAQTCKDEIDRKLLSRDLDAFGPWIDPQAVILKSRIEQAAQKLKKTPEEIRQHYAILAERFDLKLERRESISIQK
ncbi:MAG: HEAT repeat domain-containing protein [Thiothrix sp.]|uniref:HEAT repeat domain-containing protein n=1 Tax=Thiothrix sp. TaxID=1032 RepID=UPI0026331129|nr:HEAT repeat domain-containing protein [Thiothrix sp.]MDD5392699.1 HEAT repeat domain-containing protein [Thiothrix sp.]